MYCKMLLTKFKPGIKLEITDMAKISKDIPTKTPNSLFTRSHPPLKKESILKV